MIKLFHFKISTDFIQLNPLISVCSYDQQQMHTIAQYRQLSNSVRFRRKISLDSHNHIVKTQSNTLDIKQQIFEKECVSIVSDKQVFKQKQLSKPWRTQTCHVQQQQNRLNKSQSVYQENLVQRQQQVKQELKLIKYLNDRESSKSMKKIIKIQPNKQQKINSNQLAKNKQKIANSNQQIQFLDQNKMIVDDFVVKETFVESK